MNPENQLLSETLENEPENWGMRLQLIEGLCASGEEDSATEVALAAPAAPGTEELALAAIQG
ncbi:MAG: hypothetical protein ACC661_03330, partial [Verrucomicrobiales bacterium]